MTTLTSQAALDMYENAYHPDFGAAAGRYVDALMENVNWTRVYERYQVAVEATSEPLVSTADDRVYGHEVERSTAMRLHSAGVDVKFLRGGIDGWKAEGRPLAVKHV
ncbi:hypothetical protein J2W49_003315 [Hydrogenophaga palleronii]|uniref:Rhodanese domain-containing protein n=1 Tax=Hydrogenophaga palleronii TaxID=65655 RepID=A0ABU1WPW6_9BURK|nr:Fe-Mn family superoxide dismutase [Hydrogenophaga palleronii]MDR7151339.1 hypothetical protein [Hydrogenophaga palleronii]